MKTVCIECRKLDEWPEDVQKKIIEKYSTFNVEDDNWYEYEYEHWADELAKMGYDIRDEKWKDGKKYDREISKWKLTGERVSYTEIQIAFSGFWSQGDGASFTGTVDVAKWIEYNHLYAKYGRLLKLFRSGIIETSATIKRDKWGRYVHWNTTTLYIDWQYRNWRKITPVRVEELIEQISKDITENMQQLNRDIYNSLEKTYEYYTSEEAVRDSLMVNGYEFSESGKIM